MLLAQALQALRDPTGVPFYPIVFQVLMVLTFSMHIVMVNLALGSAAVALWEAGRAPPSGRGSPRPSEGN